MSTVEFYGDKYEQLATAKPLLEGVGIEVPDMFGIDQETIKMLVL